MTQNPVIALLIADIHMSSKPPSTWRGGDWFETIKNRFQEIEELRDFLQREDRKRGYGLRPSVIIAGDIFDRWNVNPELINLALEVIPKGSLVVPGQHDLPEHRYEDAHRSAYGVLVKSKHVYEISTTGTLITDHVMLYGIPWKQPIPRVSPLPEDTASVAVIHEYIWSRTKNGYPGAPESNSITTMRKSLGQFDLVVSGDNHLGFYETGPKSPSFWNCGCLFRRKRDEMRNPPRVGLLRQDLSVEEYRLDASEDDFAKTDNPMLPQTSFEDFLNLVGELTEVGTDFIKTLQHNSKLLEDAAVRGMVKKLLEEVSSVSR